MRNLGAGHDHDFFRDSLVDENPIALAHGHAIFPFPPWVHAPKLPLPNSSGK
jgi:hypothetical protein